MEQDDVQPEEDDDLDLEDIIDDEDEVEAKKPARRKNVIED